MSAPLRNLRLQGRTGNSLASSSGTAGEIFWDSTLNALRLFNGQVQGGRILADRTWVLANTSNFSGSYADLTNKPDIPDLSSLATVATSGSYTDLTNKPTIPEAVSLTGYATETYVTTAISGISIPSLTGYATEDYVDQAIGNINPEVDLTGYATESFVGTAISNLIDTAPATLNTLNELAAALNDDASFSTTVTTALGTKALIDSPTFTGATLTAGSVLFSNQDPGNTGTDTVTAPYIEAGVGLYASFFTNMDGDIAIGPSGDSTGVINFQRQAVLQQTSEVLNTKTSATGPVEHDFETGAIWYHTSISTNFTANFTRVPTTNNRTIVCTLVLQQGATAYIPNAVQIGGVGQTIKWLGSASAPTGNANKVDIVSFTLVRAGSAWAQVLGSLTSFG
jgi:hypothetical protein